MAKAIAGFLDSDFGNGGLADGEEVGSKAADEPFEEDLEDGSGDQGVEKADDCIVDVPEAADSDLADQNYGNRNK